MSDYTPRSLTVERDGERYRLTFEPSDACPIRESWDAVRWHDTVLALEFQRPSWRTEPGHAPHPVIAEILADVRNVDTTGIAAYTIAAEPRSITSTPRPMPARS